MTTHSARLLPGAMRLCRSKKKFVMQMVRLFTYTRYKLTNETTKQDVLEATQGILKKRLERQ